MEFTFFFTEASPFSQWHRCHFVVEGHTFNCAEQFMMHGKAVLFGDADMAARILEADHPRTHKALGRKVASFDGAVWERERLRGRGLRAVERSVEACNLRQARACRE